MIRQECDLILKPYTGSDNQKWKITLTSHGSYKIKAKSSEGTPMDLAMVVENSFYSNGLNIQQKEYIDDTSYEDEWELVYSIDIGLSSDDYVEGCTYRERQSHRYAYKFFEELSYSPGYVAFSKVDHFNMFLNRTASKNDFSTNGAISNDIDFMIYIGHGLTADDFRGNYLHYNCAADKTYHTSDHSSSVYNAYNSEMHFGSDASNLRWVWLYTCNFLTTNNYVTDDSLKDMMTGAHIVMGYASRTTLCDAMAQTFATCLRNREPIIRSYFIAGRDGEASATSEDHYQKVMYVPQARYETIYSPRVHYEYDSSDIMIQVRNIQDKTEI